MISNNQSNKYLSRISTNTNVDELDRLLDNNDNSKIKNLNVSPARSKKTYASDHSNNNINFNFNKITEKDPFQHMYKLPNSNSVNKQLNPGNNYGSILKYDSPNRNKNDIIDRIINENKDKFYDEVDVLKEKSGAFHSQNSRFKVLEKDFEFFDTEKKNMSSNRKRSGIKFTEESCSDSKITKGDFESRRRNKLNEILDKDNYDSYEKNKIVVIDFKKPSLNNNFNYNNFNIGKKDSNNIMFQKY